MTSFANAPLNKVLLLLLQEQLRDVMFHLAANDKINNSGMQDEMNGGDLMVGESPPDPGKSKGATRKKKAK